MIYKQNLAKKPPSFPALVFPTYWNLLFFFFFFFSKINIPRCESLTMVSQVSVVGRSQTDQEFLIFLLNFQLTNQLSDLLKFNWLICRSKIWIEGEEIFELIDFFRIILDWKWHAENGHCKSRFLLIRPRFNRTNNCCENKFFSYWFLFILLTLWYR